MIHTNIFLQEHAEELAQKDGATYFSINRVRTPYPHWFSISFFRDNIVDDEGCLFEVGTWSIDMRTYTTTNRKFNASLIGDNGREGFYTLKEI